MECINISASTSPHVKRGVTIEVNEGRGALSSSWEDRGSCGTSGLVNGCNTALGPVRPVRPMDLGAELKLKSLQC